MVTTRMIERYADEVAGHAPFYMRKHVRSQVIRTMHEMLTAVCEDEKPTVRDVRRVKEELGKPSQAVLMFCQETEKKRRRLRRRSVKIWRAVMQALTVLAVLFVIGGLGSLLIGLTGNLSLFVFGTVLGALVMIIKMFEPLPDNTGEEPGADVIRSYRY